MRGRKKGIEREHAGHQNNFLQNFSQINQTKPLTERHNKSRSIIIEKKNKNSLHVTCEKHQTS